MSPRSLLYVMVVLCATAVPASAGHIQADLLADVSAIQPGKPFWLGVRLSIDSGWHVYWKNPGDAGLPTLVKFTVPEGFTAGPLQFPTPSRFEQPGEIVAFGYENSVMLLTKITPPANLPADFQGEFQARISWLVCSNICIPGKAAVSLTLGMSPQPSPANRELFDGWISQLPAKWAGTPEVINVETASNSDVNIEVVWNHSAPDTADFFPETPDDYHLVGTQVKSAQNTTVISFTARPLAGTHPGPTTMPAVLGYFNGDGKRRGLGFSVALPARSGNNN
jgi:thiol:disulfide interchange protein DsbD